MSSPAAAWARDFFTGLFVDLWLQAIPEPQTRQEVDFLERQLRVQSGASLLDVPCGGGRHALELAGRGYCMTGVDLSTEFLKAARERSAERQASVIWEQRLMTDLPWEGTFDGAYCMGNSLGGLDEAETVVFLRGIVRTLKPGARFVLDSGVLAESILPNIKDRVWWQVGDILFLVHNRYDPVQARLNMEFTLIRGSQVEKKTGFSQIWTYRAFCQLLEEAGFRDLQGFASLTQEPYRLGGHQAYLVATNP